MEIFYLTVCEGGKGSNPRRYVLEATCSMSKLDHFHKIVGLVLILEISYLYFEFLSTFQSQLRTSMLTSLTFQVPTYLPD